MPDRPPSRTGRGNLPGLLVMGGLVAGWEVAVRAGLLDYQFLPTPSAVLRAAGGLATTGELAATTLHTLLVTLVGWALASVVGLGLGLLLGLSTTAHRYSITSFEVTRAVPPITFVPAALLVFGFSLRMELVIVTYVGVWPLLMNTIGGVRSVPPELLDVARQLRLSRAATIRKIVLPSALPSVVVGLRLGLSLCLVLAVVAEMVGNPAGLGHALVLAQQALRPAEAFAYMLTAGVLGVALNAALRAAARWGLPGSRADTISVSPW